MKITTIVILLLVIVISEAKSQKDYYKTDSSYVYGTKIIDNGKKNNSQYIEIKENQKLKRLFPEDVIEYGFADGRAYFSRKIRIGTDSIRVFLEKLTDGKIELYYYAGKEIEKFFVHKDSSFYELINGITYSRKGYKDLLRELTSDCSIRDKTFYDLQYKKVPLTRFISDYNNDCNFIMIPHRMLTLFTGIESTLLLLKSKDDEYLQLFDYKPHKSIILGASLFLPIINYTGFKTEVIYSHHQYSYYQELQDRDLDYTLRTHALKFPLLIQYNLPVKTVHPYINSGIIMNFNFIDRNRFYYTSRTENILVLKNIEKDRHLSILQVGYSLGLGVSFDLDNVGSLSFEFRYSNSGSVGGSSFGIRDLSFQTGINF